MLSLAQQQFAVAVAAPRRYDEGQQQQSFVPNAGCRHATENKDTVGMLLLSTHTHTGQLQQLSKQRPEGFWQTATKQINVRRCVAACVV